MSSKGFIIVTMSCESIKHNHRKDRMSDLPDSIILHILSVMDAKDAVRSGILSKRFSYLRTEAPCLNFEQSTLEIVNSTVCFHKRSNLEKVSVIRCRDGESYHFSESYYSRESYHSNEIEFCRFVRLLGLARVKEFVLEFATDYILPQHFYSNPYLKKFTLTFGWLGTKGFVNWKSLQSLSLTKVILLDQTINVIMSGCPSIELLVLSDCFFDSPINLTNNKCLRKLVIDRYYLDNTLVISAPNLQSLVLLGVTGWSKCKLPSIDSCLDFYVKMNWLDEDILIKGLTSLLDDLSHIEAVTIGKWVLQVLSLMELNELQCPMSKKIKFLKLRSNFTTDDMTGVACLLRNLDRLEKLVIKIRDYGQPYFVPCFPEQDQECLMNKSYCSSEIMENLKTVEILGLNEDQDVQFPYDLNDILLLVEFLLKNAKFLENITITARGSMHYLMELKNKLLGFPRSSPCAVVKIIDC